MAKKKKGTKKKPEIRRLNSYTGTYLTLAETKAEADLFLDKVDRRTPHLGLSPAKLKRRNINITPRLRGKL